MPASIFCPICQSNSLEFFLSRKNVPVHQNLLCYDFESALKVSRGDLDLFYCLNCSFIFNNSFDLSKLNYGDDYDNSQTFSPFFSNYIDDLIDYLINTKDIQNSNIIEVGCGKGLFIKKLFSKLGNNAKGYGFDPSYVGELSEFDGRLKFEKKYYRENCSDLKADLIICRHVIEHVPNPLEFILSIKKALNNGTRLFFETPSVNLILKNKVPFDFFYEHCSYFNYFSICNLFQKAGFNVDTVKEICGDQYLWIEANNSEKPISDTRKEKENTLKMIGKFHLFEKNFINYWQEKINNLLKIGNVAVWGAAAKGVTFANLIDPGKKLISCFIDLNPNKQNRFIPGTGHPIINYKDIPKFNIKSAIIMNENYTQENDDLLKKENLIVRLLECKK